MTSLLKLVCQNALKLSSFRQRLKKEQLLGKLWKVIHNICIGNQWFIFNFIFCPNHVTVLPIHRVQFQLYLVFPFALHHFTFSFFYSFIYTVNSKNINFERAINMSIDMRVTSSTLAKKKARYVAFTVLTEPQYSNITSLHPLSHSYQSPCILISQYFLVTFPQCGLFNLPLFLSIFQRIFTEGVRNAYNWWRTWYFPVYCVDPVTFSELYEGLRTRFGIRIKHG